MRAIAHCRCRLYRLHAGHEHAAAFDRRHTELRMRDAAYEPARLELRILRQFVRIEQRVCGDSGALQRGLDLCARADASTRATPRRCGPRRACGRPQSSALHPHRVRPVPPPDTNSSIRHRSRTAMATHRSAPCADTHRAAPSTRRDSLRFRRALRFEIRQRSRRQEMQRRLRLRHVDELTFTGPIAVRERGQNRERVVAHPHEIGVRPERPTGGASARRPVDRSRTPRRRGCRSPHTRATDPTDPSRLLLTMMMSGLRLRAAS